MLLHRVLRTLPWTVCLLVWAAGPPLAFGLTFTDDPLVPRITTVKVVQITELRSDIDTVRTRLGLDAFSWTDPTLVAHVTPINRMHVIDFRTALDEGVSEGRKATSRVQRCDHCRGTNRRQGAPFRLTGGLAVRYTTC